MNNKVRSNFSLSKKKLGRIFYLRLTDGVESDVKCNIKKIYKTKFCLESLCYFKQPKHRLHFLLVFVLESMAPKATKHQPLTIVQLNPCCCSWMGLRLLLLLVFLVLVASASSNTSKIVTTLPGYTGELPFTLETG